MFSVKKLPLKEHRTTKAGLIAERLLAIITSHLISLSKGTIYPAQSSFKPPV